MAHIIVGAGKSEIGRLEIQVTASRAVLCSVATGHASSLVTREFLCCNLEAELLLWGISIFALKALSLLDKALSRQSALPKVN